MQNWPFLFSSLLALLGYSSASCPDYDISTCVAWSNATSWPSALVPEDGDAVSISTCIILDTNTANLDHVTITSAGSLIFSPDLDADLTLSAKSIQVAGVLRIGSARCRYDGIAHIFLTGTRQDVADPEFGKKYIGVTAGGTLELHGAKKTPWSKVDMTLTKLTSETGLFLDSQDENLHTWQPGFMTYVIDPATRGVRFKDILYIGGDSENVFNKESERLISLLNWVPEGYIIAMASNLNPINDKFNMTPVFEAIEKAFYCKIGHSRVRHLQKGQSWVGVALREHPRRSIERIGRKFDEDDFTTAFAELKMPWTNIVIRVLSRRHTTNTWQRLVQITGALYDAAIPVVTMTDDVSSWQPGDKVVITSTDYDWQQVEEATVEKCDIHHRDINCTSNQVRLNYLRQFEHWGEINHRVDMRAEVALVSRNVRVSGAIPEVGQGSEQDRKFGGQIKIKENFADVHIQGVELAQMGQLYEHDAYPIFFDMCLNVSADSYTDPAYVRENAIVDSFRSCVVLRGTHEMRIQGNVAYKHIGSCFYLLEGGEKYNVFDGNIGISSRDTNKNNPTLMKFEKELIGTFFITNPLTYFQNNVAAGGESRGIIYAFPEIPLRDSKDKNFMQKDEAKFTALASFEQNTVHSYRRLGVDMQYSIKEDTSYSWSSGYAPREIPLEEDSGDKPVFIERLTCYKNRYENVNARGGLYVYHKNSLSDSSAGLQLKTFWFKNDSKWESIQFPRSIPLYWDSHRPIQGVSFIDGPTFLYEVWFNNFVSNEHYQAGAIGFVPRNRWWTSPVTATEKISWGFEDGQATGNRVYDGMPDVDGFGDETGDKQALFRDLDGSVTGLQDSTVVKQYPMIITDDCTEKDNWGGLYVCPHRYGKIQVRHQHHSDRDATLPLMSRDDIPSQPLDQNWQSTANFPVILGGDYSYIIFFNTSMPGGMYLYSAGLEKDQWVRFGVCVPIGAQLQLWSYAPDWRPNIESWNEVASTQELDATDVTSSYFWDKDVGVIFFKFTHAQERNNTFPYDMGQCPGGRCPMVRITIANTDAIDMTQADCRDRAYGPYTRTPPQIQKADSLPTMEMTSSEPPEDYGAGAVYNSDLVVVKDEGFGSWSEWSECTVQCGGGVTERQRECQDPTGCGGASTERQFCNTLACTDTTMNETWSTWSECSASCGGGMRNRQKECGDQECSDPTSETEPCNAQECPIDGGYSSWTTWSACSKTCAGGQRSRSRACDNPEPDHGGAQCEGQSTQLEACNEQECPIDGGFGSWTPWTTCSVTCGGGTQTRSRECDNPEPEHGGRQCEGDLTENQSCNTHTCPDGGVCITDAP